MVRGGKRNKKHNTDKRTQAPPETQTSNNSNNNNNKGGNKKGKQQKKNSTSQNVQATSYPSGSGTSAGNKGHHNKNDEKPSTSKRAMMMPAQKRKQPQEFNQRKQMRFESKASKQQQQQQPQPQKQQEVKHNSSNYKAPNANYNKIGNVGGAKGMKKVESAQTFKTSKTIPQNSASARYADVLRFNGTKQQQQQQKSRVASETPPEVKTTNESINMESFPELRKPGSQPVSANSGKRAANDKMKNSSPPMNGKNSLQTNCPTVAAVDVNTTCDSKNQVKTTTTTSRSTSTQCKRNVSTGILNGTTPIPILPSDDVGKNGPNPFKLKVPEFSYMETDTFPRFLCQFDDENYMKAERYAILSLRLALGGSFPLPESHFS